MQTEGYCELVAQGWGWLANAQRLSLDFADAEKSLAIAGGYISATSKATLVGAEFYSITASLRFSQHRMPEALELQDVAVPIYRQLEDRQGLASGLLLRAVIKHHLEDFLGAMDDLGEALKALGPDPQPFLALCAHLTMCISYMGLEEYEKAAGILPIARELSERTKSGFAAAHLRWVEGKVAEARSQAAVAIGHYRAARAQFLRLDETLQAAIVSLDLALLLSLCGQSVEVLTLAIETLPILAAAEYRSESLVAIKMLGDAIEARRLPEELLRDIRLHMTKIQREPLLPVPKVR
jgi:tetratricopeptide (TPR) repeat protein